MLGPSKAIRAAHWTDIWTDGVIPSAAYLVIASAAAAVWLAADWAADLPGAC